MPLSAEDLRFNPPSFNRAVLSRTLEDLFDLQGELKPLIGERDQNTLVTTAGGQMFVLKVSGALEGPSVTDCQTRALQHLESTAPEIPVPRLIPNRHGHAASTITAAGAEHIVRLLSYLPGITFEDARDIPLGDVRLVGSFLGQVSRALASFEHPAADHFMPWDISNALIDSDELWATASR